MDDVGIVFLDGCKDYGKSLEEVEELIQNHQNFEKDSMESITTQVEELRNMIKTFEETGHYELNRIRSIGSHLEQRWNQFECDMKTRYSNLKLSLSFQVCVYVRMYIYMYICIYMYVCIYVYMYVCIYVYVCMYVCIYVYTCMYVYMYVCMYVCIYVYTCMYVYIYN